MINVSREPQNRRLLSVNEDLRIALTPLRTQKNRYAMVLFIAISLGNFMTGCNPFEPLRPDSAELLKLGWAKQPKCPKTPEPVYCYETLGHSVCHSAPLESQSRLNSYYGPQP